MELRRTSNFLNGSPRRGPKPKRIAPGNQTGVPRVIRLIILLGLLVFTIYHLTIRHSPVPLPSQSQSSTCQYLPGGGEIIEVWAFDAAPSRPLVNTNNLLIHTRILCGNTKCMELHENFPCVYPERLFAKELARDTPVEQWILEHVLHKILSAHYYELQLQIVMQLLALYKYDGSILGSTFSKTKKAAVVGSKSECSPTIHQTGLAGASLDKNDLKKVFENFNLQAYPESATDTDKWPVAIDWQKVFSPLSCSLYVGKKDDLKHRPSLVSRNLKYGTLSYNKRREALLAMGNPGMNLGDEMQGLAGLQFLPYMDALVERDDLALVFPTQDLVKPMRNKTLVFLNAWYGSSTRTWPPPRHLDPVLVAVHTESNQATINTFDTGMTWLKEHWPVGVRDLATLEYFNSHGVACFVSNCMTTTILPLCPKRANNIKIIVVDVEPELSSAIIPQNLAVETMTHKSLDQVVNDNPILRYKHAFGVLRKYACDAKVVVTTRLHSALPSAASGTTVVWAKGDASKLPGGGVESRVSDYYPLLHKSDDPTFDWEKPSENPVIEARLAMRNRLQVMAYCHHPAIADAATKFGTVPPSWIKRLDSRSPCHESGQTPFNGASDVQVAFSVDITFLAKESAFPTFLSSLGQSNKYPISVYALTVGMTKAQQCLTRYMITQPLHRDSAGRCRNNSKAKPAFPNLASHCPFLFLVEVYIIPADSAMNDFKKQYTRGSGSHITVATMARLALPQLLPCIHKILWVDTDILILRSLVPIWEIETPTACGISARKSVHPYVFKNIKGPPEFKEAVKLRFRKNMGVVAAQGRSENFNAGILVIELDKWRTPEFAYAVEKVALEYSNDDQTVLNYFCQGNFTELPTEWNMFNATKVGRMTPKATGAAFKDNLENWGILHWTGKLKPWSEDATFADPRVRKLWETIYRSTGTALSLPLAA